ncbi:sigma-70 family RNA polymerase sigma factor [Dactylosporangium sp. NBC_01737]|uniref:sigma-70 family RNA polymerase sigma factor n=1 Tax=Dactylosporangium sp. NBC_01737 TaxID=2975959 RepID=UPI002E0E5BA9|nr:sigma-70 family RNA polymerase sigma factor [Dactylosporangium sp. NBC_01737]
MQDVRFFAHAHGQALLVYVRRLVNGDVHLAEDIVQETLVRAWQHPAAFLPGSGSARGWLFSVAHNLAVDAQRRRTRRGEVAVDVVPDAPIGDRVNAVLLRHEVHEALARLSADHRAVMVELHLNGYTMAEVARRLQVPIGTVKSRAYYAQRQLSAILRQRGVDRTVLCA